MYQNVILHLSVREVSSLNKQPDFVIYFLQNLGLLIEKKTSYLIVLEYKYLSPLNSLHDGKLSHGGVLLPRPPIYTSHNVLPVLLQLISFPNSKGTT